mgnify:CR=1 FL=1
MQDGSLAAAITPRGRPRLRSGARGPRSRLLVSFVQRATRDRIADLESITRTNAAAAGAGSTRWSADDRRRHRPSGHRRRRRSSSATDGSRTWVRGRDVVIPPDVPRVPRRWQDGRAGPVGHAHARHADRVGAGLSRGRRDDGPRHGQRDRVHDAAARRDRVRPCARSAACCSPGSSTAAGANAFGVVYAANAGRSESRSSRSATIAGFQQIKIYSLVTPPMVEAICAEAHRLGMTVTGHVPNGMTIEQAAAAGMDHIAHLPIRGEAGQRRRQEDDRVPARAQDGDRSDAVVERAARPCARRRRSRRFSPGSPKIPPPLNRLFSSAGAAGHRRADGAHASRARPPHRQGAPRRRGAGRRRAPTRAFPGHSVHREIELYVDAGLTPMEALQAATIVPARAMKLDAELGTIERGKRADMVVLERQPARADPQHPQRFAGRSSTAASTTRRRCGRVSGLNRATVGVGRLSAVDEVLRPSTGKDKRRLEAFRYFGPTVPVAFQVR